MGVAADLLEQAEHLATYQGEQSKQTSLRRAVSTAYYAIFHLLTEEASQKWQGTPESKTGIQRGFSHRAMRSVSKQFQMPNWSDCHEIRRPVPSALRRVALTFADLQELRHTADYDSHKAWSDVDVREVIAKARAAFDDWQSIRTDPMSSNYLLAMLLPKQR